MTWNASYSNPFNKGYDCFGVLIARLLNAQWPQNFYPSETIFFIAKFMPLKMLN